MNLIRIMLVSIAAVSFQLCFSQEITSNEDKYLIVLDVQEYFTLNQLSDSSSSSSSSPLIMSLVRQILIRLFMLRPFISS